MKTILLSIALLCAVSLGGQIVNGRLVNATIRNAQPTPAAALVSFADTFDRADADPMSTTSSDGGTWTSGEGAFDNCKIVANNLSGASGAGTEGGCRVLTPTFGANQSATITLGTVFAAAGVMVRVQSASVGSGYMAAIDDSTHISVYKVADSGVFTYTLLGAQFTVATLNVLDTVTLSVSGTTLTLSVNGSSQGTRTDATYATGQPGIYFFGISSAVAQFSATDL